MEIDAISVVKYFPQFDRFTDHINKKDLDRSVSCWMDAFGDIAIDEHVALKPRRYIWDDIDVTQELPTDLLVYFLHELEPNLSLEVQQVICDGRVHIVLLMAYREIPNADWVRNIPYFPLRAHREGSILIPDQDSLAVPFVRIWEMSKCTERDIRKLFSDLVRQKQKYDVYLN